MADVFLLTRSDVENVAALFADASGQTNDLITMLQSRVTELNAGWQGDSYNAFANLFNDVSTNLKQVVDLYNDMSTMLKQTAQTAMEVDSGLASGMAGR